MQADQLEQYIALLDAHGLTRLEFEQGETRVILERQPQPQPQLQPQSQPQPQFLNPTAPLMPELGQSQLPVTTAGGTAGQPRQTGTSPQENHGFAAHLCVVQAPLVGSAYKSRGPDAEPFVAVGSKVRAGDVLCLLEAMKHYNEITAPCAGTVTQILFEDGELAEFNLPLFVIEPED